MTGHICHIYAVSKAGPRGKSGFTEEDLNSPENLILLCRNHHALVDGQPETYPAEMLKEWKEAHETEMRSRLSSNLGSIQSDVFFRPCFPTALVDQKIEHDVHILRKSRFFVEFDRVGSSLALARRLVEGELSGGTDAVRGWALAWCARSLSPNGELDKAEEYLNLAKRFGTVSEIDIADAFITSRKGDKNAALKALAGIESPRSRSAALMVVARHEGAQGAVEWMKTARVGAEDLDPDGKYFFLVLLFELANWEDAREVLNVLTHQDLDETPILHHIMAITYLLSTVPGDFRPIVRNQLPLNAASFPLSSDSASIDARRTAHRHFTDAAKAARKLNCPEAAKVDDEYAFWLELRAPETSENGRKRLEANLRDHKSTLHLVPLGVQFGINLDLEVVEKEIDRQIALHGGITLDAATARFALAFTQKTPEARANYIARHYDGLSKYIEKKSMLIVQIEMLLQAGQFERANECLELLLEHGLSPTDESRIRTRITEAEGSDPVETLKELFKKTNLHADLVALVEKLEAKEDWNGLCKYGEILFRRTCSVGDAERLANALTNAQKSERLVTFLKSNHTLLAQSNRLRMFYAWSLYYEGSLLEARNELAKLSDDREDPNYRALQVHLGIALGDWNSLSEFVANEYKERDQRSAQDLMGSAQLALHLGSLHAKELLFTAAGRGNDDADILSTAYFLATSAGWDDDPEVFQWIQRAEALSGDNGPIRRMTLKDLFDRKPEWDRRESEIWQLLSRGEIPMFLAAQSLNKSLVNLMLFPALANLSESDPRRTVPISAYSGKRQSTLWDTRRSIGMDLTALFTLSFLNLLDKALDAFEVVYVPHSTLGWMFEEKQKTAFHQPSRIRDANRLRDLLARELLEKFVPSTVGDSHLSAQVGDELAMLIAEAEMNGADDHIQRIVVRPSPVHRLSSLMQEEADLTAHATVLSSCQSVVDKLREKGQLTIEEEKRSRTFLQVQEKPWLNQPAITDGAILFLDDLAITYFLRIGILEKLKAAGFRPIASPRRVSEADQLISYESFSDRVGDALECIRSALSSRIESGKIKVGRRRNVGDSSEKSISEHPSVGVVALASDCDAIISDDRFINQHANIGDDCLQVPVFSTLDLLEALTSAGTITFDNQLEYRTQLRRAGYFFIPVRENELTAHLSASRIRDGKVIETAELKAIRENILGVRISDWLQVPKEAPWLSTTLEVFIRSLKTLWVADADLTGVTARSNWLVDQLDIRGWVHSLGPENGDNLVKEGRGTHILMLLILPFDAPQKVRDTYWDWVEERVLLPLKEQYPELYARIVDQYRRRISEIADFELEEGGTT